jgi:hypothetical protein
MESLGGKKSNHQFQPMKIIRMAVLGMVTLLSLVLTACGPSQPPEPQIEGLWRYEAPVSGTFGGVRTERLDIKLLPDSKAEFLLEPGGIFDESFAGTWKRQGDLLALTRTNSSFVIYKIVSIDQAELRALNREGKLYRFVRMPKE